MKKILVILTSILVLTAASFTGCTSGCDPMATAFTVLQISDIHIRNDERDDKAFETTDMLIAEVAPDLIIVTGDVTSESDSQAAIMKFAGYMESKQIPWAFTFGNHDGEGNWSKQEINDYLLSLTYCIYERGNEQTDGYGNYYYNVINQAGKAVMSLIMMDSNMYYPDQEASVYDNFHDNQIEWYENTVKSIALTVNGDESLVLPSLAFFHIPLYETPQAYAEAYASAKILYGNLLEEPCSPKIDDEMFETMVRLGSTKGVYFGHDHMNDFAVNYNGIRFTYCNTADNTLFFSPRRGGTVIYIKNNGEFYQKSLYRSMGAGELNIGDAV